MRHGRGIVRRRVVGFGLAAALCGPNAVAQERLMEFSSQRTWGHGHDFYGSQVSWIGDVDRDGVPDALVAARNEDDGVDTSRNSNGAIYLISPLENS